jgi:PAS domain S-box-containing protein
MSAPTARNLASLKQVYDTGILGVLHFPAFIFEVNTLVVIESNGFFNDENNIPFPQLLAKYNFNFLDATDIKHLTQSLKTGRNYSIHKISDSQKEIRTFEIRASLLPESNNVLLYLNLISANTYNSNTKEISTIQENEKITEESDFLTQLFDNVYGGIGLINDNYNIIFCNRSFGQILGADEKNLSGNNFFEIVGNENKSIVEKELTCCRTKQDSFFEIKILFQKTSEKNIQIYARPRFDAKGVYIGAFLTLLDITDRVKMEGELIRARDKAQEADKLKTTFLTNMSHEIRTPMNSILGFSSMLKLKGVTRQKRDQYLDIIISRGKLLMEIINDILDVTKLDEDQIQISPCPCILNDLLRDLYQSFDSNMRKSRKPVKLVMHPFLPDDQSTIIADGLYLHQVISNLLNNAEKFSESGYIEFGYVIENNGTLLFYVRDTGIGVPSDMKEIIFERFRQADESFTRIYGGMGLGLSICQGLVNLMGGRIWVESDGKTGSTFYFTIPYHPHCERPLIHFQTIDEVTNYWTDKNILVVEDDPASYEYLNEILSSNGCNVLHASNGSEALKLFRESASLHMILLDIQLPEMDGYQIARSIRKTNKSIPIIAQTAHAMPEDRKKCLDAGCNDYLTKPIQYDLLINTLKKFFVNR